MTGGDPLPSLAATLESTSTADQYPDGARVLVVDDEPVIRRFLGQALQRAGYNVRCAPDGQAGAVELLRWRPDVVLLDLVMPRMHGWDFARVCDESVGRRPRIVLISALGEASAQAAREIGAWHILAKPFDLDELLELLEVVTTTRAA